MLLVASRTPIKDFSRSLIEVFVKLRTLVGRTVILVMAGRSNLLLSALPMFVDVHCIDDVIAFLKVCYYAVAVMEIFLPRNVNNKVLGIESAQGGNIRSGLKSIATLLRRYSYHWLVAALLLAVHSGIMYGVDVPPAFGFECGRGVRHLSYLGIV